VASFLRQLASSLRKEAHEEFSSLSESGFIPTTLCPPLCFPLHKGVLISFREWLHSYEEMFVDNLMDLNSSSHLFQRVASFLHFNDDVSLCKQDICSHLFQRVASFLPNKNIDIEELFKKSSHLFQRVASFLRLGMFFDDETKSFLFSSLSESGFIPTGLYFSEETKEFLWVLISFREWLHSYTHHSHSVRVTFTLPSSHLFQRVASFLHLIKEIVVSLMRLSSHLFQRVASFLPDEARAVL